MIDRRQGTTPQRKTTGSLVAAASGGSSDLDDDNEDGAQPDEGHQQHQVEKNANELLEDFLTYFNTTFKDNIKLLLLGAEDLGSRRALLGDVVTAKHKINRIKKLGEGTLSLGDKFFVFFVLFFYRSSECACDRCDRR
jgi:hypothetical protein